PDRASIVEAKLSVLRLLRALDRAGADPSKTPALGIELVHLAEYDDLLTACLELLDRLGPGSEDAGENPIEKLVEMGSQVRGAVLRAVPAILRRDVLHSLSTVTASEPEIWMQVEALRRGPAKSRLSKPVLARETPEELAAQAFSRASTVGNDPLVR